MLKAIKTEFGQYSVERILDILPQAEVIVKRTHGTKKLWQRTRMKVLLAILEGVVLPGKYMDLLHRTPFREKEIYTFRKLLTLEGILANRFVDKKQDMVRQAIQLVTEANFNLDLKQKAVLLLTYISSQSYVPSVKRANILGAIALKAATEILEQEKEIPTIQIAREMECSYIPQKKVQEILGIVETHSGE